MRCLCFLEKPDFVFHGLSQSNWHYHPYRVLCIPRIQIAFAVVSALQYLHAELKVIHRDVKPSNILINRRGEVKMCDFGISGYLVDSVAKTIDAGCKPYMAPERIDPCGEWKRRA